jgi:lipopolysaccharide/colanic/teichoic acid biosynthesis glycosyltransferase
MSLIAPPQNAPAHEAPPHKVLVRPRRGVMDYHVVKRAADLAGALVLLVVLSPLLLVIAIAIKLDSPGPIIYPQERMGSRRRRIAGATVWEPRPFVFLKFRTMVADADVSVHQAHVEDFVRGRLQVDDTKARFKLSRDPRVTRFGRILRRTSLDELPQLVNVISGEMSLVGPRPVPLYEVALYDEPHHERFAAAPGMTGLWQVRGRCDVSFQEMIELDIAYVRKQSLWLDTRILFLTIPAVMGGRGAG